MNKVKLSHQHLHKLLIMVAVVLFVGSAIYGVATGQDYFSDNNLRALSVSVKAYGYLAPLVIFAGIFLSQAIPFFPIPTQFFEIATGLIYGIWPGLILAWVSQMATGIICFVISDRAERHFAKKIESSPVFIFFNKFIQKHQWFAIFAIRATMTSPLNVSYLAGVLDMSIWPFLLATGLGVISEITIFVYLGTLISAHVHFSLWLIFVFVMGLSLIPALAIGAVNSFRPTKS